MTTFSEQLRGKRVFLTGHTGFTGSWLALWLCELDCAVTGYSLAPEGAPNLFEALRLESRLASHHVADIRDHVTLRRALAAAQPEVVLHLAAQPLVRRSYLDPLETVSTNVLGTVNVLEAARHVPTVRAFVSVTTDKVYENREWPYPYRETDRLGGKDPYSASKACAEIMTRCYQETMAELGNRMRIASARGGNIIGGGDFSEDRIVPDFYRAALSSRPLVVRSPDAIRPWQHVLSACHGYLAIAAHLLSDQVEHSECWNIGPSDTASVSVRSLISMLSQHSAPVAVEFGSSSLVEAQTLRLDVHKAKTRLGFDPPWSTHETVRRTADWYRRFYEDQSCALNVSMEQLNAYCSAKRGSTVGSEGVR